MSVLENLPNEILAGIISCLCFRDLVQTSRVSRLLRAIAERFLYKDVRLDGPRPIGALLRTILSHPAIAKHVLFLEISWEFNLADGPDCWLGPHDTCGLEPATAETMRVGLQSELRWQGTQVVHLLHLLQNLRALLLFPPDIPDVFDHFLERTELLPAESLPAGLKSVRDIELWWGTGDRGVTPESLMTIFKMPSVRGINIQIVEATDEVGSHLASVSSAGISSVTNLSLNFGSISASSLGRVLQMPRALTNFSYLIGCESLHPFNAPAFGLALRTVRATLQHLTLTFTDDMLLDFGDTKEHQTIGSLRDWPVLRSLRCPLMPLLGRAPHAAESRLVDVVPMAIREFATDFDSFWGISEMVNQVTEMLEQMTACGLEHLAVVSAGGHGGLDLALLCLATGVEHRE